MHFLQVSGCSMVNTSTYWKYKLDFVTVKGFLSNQNEKAVKLTETVRER